MENGLSFSFSGDRPSFKLLFTLFSASFKPPFTDVTYGVPILVFASGYGTTIQSGTEDGDNMRETMKKKLVVLTGAAVLMAGSGMAITANPVMAETAGTGVGAGAQSGTNIEEEGTKAANPSYIDMLTYKTLSSLLVQASAASDQDYDTFYQSVASGQSLADASGLGAAVLASKLKQSVGQSIQANVESGLLTAKEAEQASASADAIIEKVVSVQWKGVSLEQSIIGGHDLLQSFLNGIVQQTADLYELSATELRKALRDGQSLAEASGQTEGALISDLKQSLSDMLTEAVQSGKLMAVDADKRYREGEEAIKTIVSTKGYDSPATPWMERFGNELVAGKLGFAINLTAIYSDKELDDIYAALRQGGTLVSASGLSEGELLADLTDAIDQAIEQAWLAGNLSLKVAEQLKTQASEQVKTAITTAGYGISEVPATVVESVYGEETANAEETVKIDVNQYVQHRLNQIVDDTARLTDTDAKELLGRLSSGQSLSQAARTDNDSLLYGLVSSISRQLNEYVASGALSEEESARAKSDYASQLLKLLASQ